MLVDTYTLRMNEIEARALLAMMKIAKCTTPRELRVRDEIVQLLSEKIEQ